MSVESLNEQLRMAAARAVHAETGAEYRDAWENYRDIRDRLAAQVAAESEDY